jgi:hypothetical protein
LPGVWSPPSRPNFSKTILNDAVGMVLIWGAIAAGWGRSVLYRGGVLEFQKFVHHRSRAWIVVETHIARLQHFPQGLFRFLKGTANVDDSLGDR